VVAKKNDLLGWNPKSSVLLCVAPVTRRCPCGAPGCDESRFRQPRTEERHVGGRRSHDPGGLRIGGKAPTDPTSAAFATYYGSYHGTYEPPFCHVYARGLFDKVK
jgi:hypothetical protein